MSRNSSAGNERCCETAARLAFGDGGSRMSQGRWGAGIKAVLPLVLFLSPFLGLCQRVVSLAPGVTEIVFALGRGDSLVGITTYCDYPPEVKRLARVGGFLDINLEALVALAPDIVIAYPEHEEKIVRLKGRIKTVIVRHGRLRDLLDSILRIGRVLDRRSEAETLVSSIERTLCRLASQAQGKRKLPVLFIAGRNAGELKNMFVVGKNDFLSEILEICGGKNAYGGAIDYPSMSLESVISLQPEFIFELSSHFEGLDDRRIFDLWRPYVMVPAVAKKQVRIIRDSFWLRPGPRVGRIAEELARMLAAAGSPGG
ncbi:MAG: ABC transporter substrate-binding protein [Candidatus Aminicenantes bacterium]|nr:ABC transporter substrate-binding protein [Candidatus Aminicenantes bacterium]